MFGVDRSTIYRMAEDGRLPAVKIGRQWRFPAGPIADIASPALAVTRAPAVAPALAAADPPMDPAVPGLPATTTPGLRADAAVPGLPADAAGAGQPAGTLAAGLPGHAGVPGLPAQTAVAGLPAGTAVAVIEVAARLLDVMMVVTDMQGRPATPVANPCGRLSAAADDRVTVAECMAEWRQLADELDLAPRFRLSPMGFECARAYVRTGTTLAGMVIAGGVAPEGERSAGLYQLDAVQRRAVLAALPVVAATLSRAIAAPDRTAARAWQPPGQARTARARTKEEAPCR